MSGCESPQNHVGSRSDHGNANKSDNTPDAEENDSNKNESDKQNEMPPEVPDLDLLKLSCQCSNCHHWSTSVDWCTTSSWEFADDNKHTILKNTNLPPLLKSADFPGKEPKINAYYCDSSSRIDRQSAYKVVVHGVMVPRPIKSIAEAYFHADIQKSMKALNYMYSKVIQSFAWPAIFRQLNVFMIGSSRSGKTMAYLPAICSFLLQSNEKYAELSKYKGPLIIVLCTNSKQCEEIYDLMQKLYEFSAKPRITLLTYPLCNVISTDIVITLPAILVKAIQSRMFNLKRLCHIVLEDASNLLKCNSKNVYSILKVADEMLTHRTCNKNVQLIASSETWSYDIGNLLKSIYATPLVCIENFLEAALYGNVNFKVDFVLSRNKLKYLEGILKDRFQMYKTIIVCENSDVTIINMFLTQKGIGCIYLLDDSSKEKIENEEETWSSLKCGKYKVLICTDFVFDALLTVSDAMWLIHYSFSKTWTRFVKRFAAISSQLRSPLISQKSKPECTNFLLFDENCEKQMPRVFNLLTRLTKDFPVDYQKYSHGVKVDIENDRIRDKTEFCSTLKLFGACSKPLCSYRHTPHIDLDFSNSLPRNGKINFKIIEIIDVTLYAIQIIEHYDFENTVHKFNRSDCYKELIFDTNVDKKQALQVEVKKFYSYCDLATNKFMLCQVLRIVTEKFVEVKLLRTGEIFQTHKQNLYELPSNLKLVEAYLCNLVPPYDDRNFSARSFYTLRKVLDQINFKSVIFSADVSLQLNNKLWLDHVVQNIKVGGTEIVKFNLTKRLRDLGLVDYNENQINRLRKLCDEHKIVLPPHKKPNRTRKIKVKEVKPQQAFLNDEVNDVILISGISPDEFYVRLTKFNSLLENLTKEMNFAVEKEAQNEELTVSVGKYYLAPDPLGPTYSRVRILQVQDDSALCFYVDYGDEAVKKISELRVLPTKFIKKLPFQAIRCSLYGILPVSETWSEEATDILYNYIFEPDSNIFRSMYVKVCKKTESENPVLTTFTYSVLLKDGFGDSHDLINNVLVESGLGVSVVETEDIEFEIPTTQSILHEEEWSDEDVVDNANINENAEMNKKDEEFDTVIFNAKEFLGELFQNKVGSPGSPAINVAENNIKNKISQEKTEVAPTTDITDSAADVTTDTPEESSTYLTPELYWSQTDQFVKLKIKLIGVESYKVNVIKKRVFLFSTVLNDKTYEIKITLYKTAQLQKHSAKGQEIQVVLSKVLAENWPQLTAASQRKRNIHYEFTDKELEDAPKKRFLQLDISDVESDENDDDVMYQVVSDLDSEYDDEIQGSD